MELQTIPKQKTSDLSLEDTLKLAIFITKQLPEEEMGYKTTLGVCMYYSRYERLSTLRLVTGPLLLLFHMASESFLHRSSSISELLPESPVFYILATSV